MTRAIKQTRAVGVVMQNVFHPWLLASVVTLIVGNVPARADEAVKRQATTNRIQICAVDLHAQSSTVLFDVGDFVSIDSIDVSSDGQFIAFAGVPSYADARQLSNRVLTCRMDGTERRSLTAGMQPSWSPRGQRLAFSRPDEQGVWIMRADGSDQQLIDRLGTGARWSPDGRRIAYVLGFPDGGVDLAVFNIVEDEYASALGAAAADFRSIDKRLTWSADSQTIGFIGIGSGGDVVAAAVPVKGGDAAMESVVVSPTLQARMAGLTPHAWFLLACAAKSKPAETADVFQLHRLHRPRAASPSGIEVVRGPSTNRVHTAACLRQDGKTLIYVSREATDFDQPR